MEPPAPLPPAQDVRVLALAEDIKHRLASGDGFDERCQETLARLLSLLYELRKPQFAPHLPEWEIAVRALLASPRNEKLATELYERIRLKVRPPLNPLVAVMRGGSPPTRVILGLGALLYLAIPLLIIYLPGIINRQSILGADSAMLAAVGISGAVGSIVSIMVRIQDFGKAGDVDPSVLYMTGFFKPVVGSAFALFIFAVLKAGLIPLTINQGAETYFYTALAFVSGFSERFAKDVASAAEKKIGGAVT